MENLLLLHGALGAASTLEPLKQALQQDYQVHTLSFTGHGGNKSGDQPFSIELFAQDVQHYLEQQQIAQAHIFGYSMGGYVALYLAQQHPQLVQSVFTLATKFAWSEEAAAKEVQLLNPDKIKEKVPKFAAILAERHAPLNWEQVMRQTAAMMLQLGSAPLLTPAILSQINQPMQVALGDRDNMVTLEETIAAYRNLPYARLLVLPDTRHPLETIPVTRLKQEIATFISSAQAPLPV